MSTLMSHTETGARVTLEDLKMIATPEPTSTWVPIGHAEMAINMKRWASDYLADNYSLMQEEYSIAHKGAQMFGLMTFKNGSDEMGLSIGFRNSINKSIGAAIALGAQVFVCDNMALRGDIMIMRKHTLYVMQDLEEMAIAGITRASNTFGETLQHAEALKQISYTNDQAFEELGWLYGNGILTPRQLPVVKKEWEAPQHKDFSPRTAWSFYNACTEAMKTTPPNAIMERFTGLTKAFELN